MFYIDKIVQYVQSNRNFERRITALRSFLNTSSELILLYLKYFEVFFLLNF